jgi:hypothetical protein
MTPAPVIPGAGADKHATQKPLRPVIPIRRASIRIIRVVAPRAYRGGIIVVITAGIIVRAGAGAIDNRRPDANANADLRLGRYRKR